MHLKLKISINHKFVFVVVEIKIQVPRYLSKIEIFTQNVFLKDFIKYLGNTVTSRLITMDIEKR